jgi:hypothetical protein
MIVVSVVAAGGNADLVVGLLLGAGIGFLVGPGIRSWAAYREWAEASREARLADRLLERLEIDADLDEQPRPSDTDATHVEPAWRTTP